MRSAMQGAIGLTIGYAVGALALLVLNVLFFPVSGSMQVRHCECTVSWCTSCCECLSWCTSCVKRLV